MNSRKIDFFFKRKDRDEENLTHMVEPQRVLENPRIEENINRGCADDIENSLERDPGKLPTLWEYNVNQIDEIEKSYLKWGPYQMHLEQYPLSGKEDHQRHFQHTWFILFSSWLEYPPSEDVAYCLPCYLFSKRPSGRPGSDVSFVRVLKVERKLKWKTLCIYF